MKIEYVLLLYYLITTVNSSFHLYKTNVSDNYDYKDCLYSFTIDYEQNEWQLIPYCIRHNIKRPIDHMQSCNVGEKCTFKELKSKNITCHDLYKWNVPIDTINDYQKYFIQNDLLLSNHYFFNCSGEIIESSFL